MFHIKKTFCNEYFKIILFNFFYFQSELKNVHQFAYKFLYFYKLLFFSYHPFYIHGSVNYISLLYTEY